jgi:hypothetical protein
MAKTGFGAEVPTEHADPLEHHRGQRSRRGTPTELTAWFLTPVSSLNQAKSRQGKRFE